MSKVKARKMRGGGMVKKTGVRKMRGGGMVKKTGVKKFSTGGRVNLGAGDPSAAGRLGSDILTAGMIYGAYKYGKKKGKSGGGKKRS